MLQFPQLTEGHMASIVKLAGGQVSVSSMNRRSLGFNREACPRPGFRFLNEPKVSWLQSRSLPEARLQLPQLTEGHMASIVKLAAGQVSVSSTD